MNVECHLADVRINYYHLSPHIRAHVLCAPPSARYVFLRPFYGWFCCNAFLSSIFGCGAYASRLVSLHLFFTANSIGAAGNLTIADNQFVNEQLATVLQCTAAFYFLFPFELGFSIIAKLLVLHRMKQFAMSKSLHPRRWLLAGRVLVALTVVCISVGILGNIPTAIHYSNSGDLFRQTATAYSQRNLALANDLASQASEKASNGDSAASIQRFSEVIALLAIITAFCIVTLSSLHIIGVALRYLITKSRNSEQQDAIRGKLFAAASEQGVTRATLCIAKLL